MMTIPLLETCACDMLLYRSELNPIICICSEKNKRKETMTNYCICARKITILTIDMYAILFYI